MKNNLLSIGELSKITGVHIQSLRYYDKLGILTPAFVDPDSHYRYYSFEQKAIVDAISFCVEFNIPLKQFHQFTDKGEGQIGYAHLLEQGTNIIKKKLSIMEESLSRMKTMQAEIQRSEVSYHSSKPREYFLPSRVCWIIPYEGTQRCEEFQQLTKKLILQIHGSGHCLGNSGGTLLKRKNGQWKQYLFVDLCISSHKEEKHDHIIHIPEGNYLCKKVDISGLENVWKWCLPIVQEKQIQYVIETELFVGNYTFSNPVLEQRCLLF